MEPASVSFAGAAKENKPISRNVDTLVSVCAVVPQQADRLEAFVRETIAILEASFAYYELLLIDNGTSIEVHGAVQELQQVVPNVRMLRLSRNYPNEVAIAAALDHCVGDYVAVMDSLSHPPGLIPEMVKRAIEGYDAVVAEPTTNSRSVLEKLIATPAYKVASKIMGFQLRPEESYFRVFSRRLVNSLIKIRSKNRSLSCMHGLIGLRKCTLFYTPAKAPVRPSAIKRVVQQLTLAADIVVSNSAIPLRFAACLGLLASGINLLYLFYIMAVTLVKSRIAEGWITTSLMHTVMFLLMFLIMAILAEYVARILDETKEQPLYFIESETNSSVSATSQERLNIV
ncbi:MAG TPA: glycosyltransferase [Bryobacteraceae bacterium]|nr:glycosyltransferase [Bryobacteraceae bacterium]